MKRSNFKPEKNPKSAIDSSFPDQNSKNSFITTNDSFANRVVFREVLINKMVSASESLPCLATALSAPRALHSNFLSKHEAILLNKKTRSLISFFIRILYEQN